MNSRLFQAALAAAILTIPSGVRAAEPMGQVVAVEGRPLATGTGGSRPLSAGADVFEGDTITVTSGNVQLRLDDDTRLVVGPSSRLVLQAYLRRNDNTAKRVGLKALRGTFRVITGKSPKKSYNIATSNATIGIRGTEFDFTVSDKTIVAVLGGSVRIRGSNGQVVDTGAGCGVAEAGGNVDAQELEGQPKADALNNELPYITDQSNLDAEFQLPVENCLTSLGSNDGTPGTLQPQQLLPLVPAGIVPAIIILTNKGDDPISGANTPPPPTPPPTPPQPTPPPPQPPIP
jgi:hypothetical protein